MTGSEVDHSVHIVRMLRMLGASSPLPYMPLGLHRYELPFPLHWPEQKVYPHTSGQIPKRTPYHGRPDV